MNQANFSLATMIIEIAFNLHPGPHKSHLFIQIIKAEFMDSP